MNVSFNGIGEMAVTFEATAGLKAGDPVKMADNCKVTSCSAGDRMCGVALFVSEDEFATVQMKGYTCMEYTGTDPVIGYGCFVADGNGKIKVDSAAEKTGSEYLIVDVDTAAKTVGFYM